MLTLQFVPYTEIEQMSSLGKIRKLLNIAKEDKIVLLQGRLSKDEEKELIKTTMEEIDLNFKGIELAVIDNKSENLSNIQKLRKGMLDYFLGNSQGLTIIGPASVVKEIKKNPSKIELLTTNGLRKPKKSKNRSKKRR